MCLVAVENSIFRICISVDWKKQAFDPEIILQFYFHFKWILDRERKRERETVSKNQTQLPDDHRLRSTPTSIDWGPLRRPQIELRTNDDQPRLHRLHSDPPTVSFLHSDPPSGLIPNSDPPFMFDPPSHLPKIHPQTHKPPLLSSIQSEPYINI